MNKYKVYLIHPKIWRGGLKKVGEYKTLKLAEREGRNLRKKIAEKSGWWATIVIYKDNKVFETI